MKQLSSGTVEKVSCGALKFRCCNKHFDKLLPLLLQGWWFFKHEAALFGYIGEGFLRCFEVQVLQVQVMNRMPIYHIPMCLIENKNKL